MKQEDKRDIRNRPLKRIRVLFVLMFLGLIGNILYFVFVEAEQDVLSEYNPRLEEIEAKVIRGDILDRKGKALAMTELIEGEQKRVYPYGGVFAHTVGYIGVGKTGLESYANLDLIRTRNEFTDQFKEILSSEPAKANSLVTSLDGDLQQLAYDLLGDNRGAVVAMDPRNGEILAMVSKPDFDPNGVLADFEVLRNDSDGSPLLNRATQGLYPPGSTFKTITTIAYLEKHNADDFFNYCAGQAYVGQKVIHCYDNHAHGRLSLDEAFAQSCNTSYGLTAETLEGDRLAAISNPFLFNAKLDLEIENKKSKFTLTSASEPNDKVETAIGQGETLITPLNNVLIACAIANEGTVYKPHLVNQVISAEGRVVKETEKSVYRTIMTPSMANTLEGYMTLTSEMGTADTLNTERFKIASKTGTAEKDGVKPFAWYIGYAPVDNPQIALAIVVENVGASTVYAVPIADAIYQSYLGD